jgi:hypothetical protein
MDNLNTDILVSRGTIDTLDVFSLHNESLIPSIPRLRVSDLIIRHIGSFQQGVTTL